ncbi:YolD-like family protein [Neobacillus mesonae]|uniref:YolD-like family protein n=1 Tax=Neobacillus mesonae TaxID=1193713 RepID=UPI000835B785|nr:YolD-like family protein [Neobacillus mesonae]
MAIRDRGMVKWQAAFQLPELAKKQRNFWRCTERISKPIIDENEAEEFDLRIIYSMEYGHAVSLKIWDDGFTWDITGCVHYVDPITNELRIEVEPGKFEKVAFDNVVGVKVVN